MSIIDHVAELRAELSGSMLTKRERADPEAELRAALAALVRATNTVDRPETEAIAA